MGKLIKVAAGIFHTHSKIADGRMETICTFAALLGAPQHVIHRLYQCVTTEEAQEIIEEEGLERIYSMAVEKAAEKCQIRVRHAMEVGCVMFRQDGVLLAQSKNSPDIQAYLREERR